MYQTILTELAEGILTITVNRPDKLNALNRIVIEELAEVIGTVYDNPEVKGAILTGALLSLSRFATWALSPILQLLAPIAPIAWIPTAIVVFGINDVTAIFIVFMGVYFILTLATLAEIRRIPPEFGTVAGNLGATPAQRWLWVTLPAILPGVFVLLRSNFIAAWMAVLVAEMVGLRDGLGAIIMMGRNLFNNELVMFGMVVIGLTGFIVDRLLQFIGQRILWWRV